MADRPILFSAPMIRALLSGTKTQTRRLFKNVEKLPSGNFHIYANGGGVVGAREEDVPAQAPDYARIQVGDRLWVRETWAPLSALTHNDPGAQALADGGFYRADGGTVDGEISKWLPSIFMPRYASRLVLAVTDVRVERLQNISEEDAVAEGIRRCPGGNGDQWMDYPEGSSAAGWLDPRRSYRSLWNSINGAGAWDANPWIVAYSFTVHRGNIDEIEQVGA